jgi:hypothetical protein
MFQLQVDSVFYCYLFGAVVPLVVGVDFDVDVLWLKVLIAADIEPYCGICL